MDLSQFFKQVFKGKNKQEVPNVNKSFQVVRVYTFSDFPTDGVASPIQEYFHPYVENKIKINKEYANRINEHLIRAPKIYYLVNNYEVYLVFKDYKLGYVMLKVVMVADKFETLEFYVLGRSTMYYHKEVYVDYYDKMSDLSPELHKNLHDLYYFARKRFSNDLEL